MVGIFGARDDSVTRAYDVAQGVPVRRSVMVGIESQQSEALANSSVDVVWFATDEIREGVLGKCCIWMKGGRRRVNGLLCAYDPYVRIED